MADILTAAGEPRDGDVLTREQHQRAVWVLDVWGPRRIRWATVAMDAHDDTAGTAFRLLGGLSVQFTEQVAWWGGAGESTLQVSGLRPPPGLNLARLYVEGVPFDGSVAELSVWDPDLPWSSRVVRLRGQVSGSRLGGVDEPISFTVAPRRRNDLPQSPRVSEVVDIDTWTESTLPGEGAAYPIVYGKPGHRSASVTDKALGYPGGVIDESDLAGGSPAYVVHYEGEKTGAAQGELSGVMPDAETDPGRVLALVTGGHAFNATGNLLYLLRRYDLQSKTGSTPTSGGMALNSGRLSDVTTIKLNREDLAAQDLDGYAAAQFIGRSVSIRWVLGDGRKAAYTITTAVLSADVWTLGVSWRDKSGEGFPAVGNDFRVSLNLAPVEGTSSVDIINVTRENARLETVPLLIAHDNLGQPVTLVELTSAYRGDDPWLIEDELWTIWQDSEGGLTADRIVGPLRGAGDVVEYRLRTGGVDVDSAAWAALREELAPYFIDTYVDEPQDAWEYVSGTLLPMLPLGTIQTPSGLAPVLWRADVTEADAQAHITAGMLGIERRGQPKVSADWSTEVRVRYSPRTDGSSYNSEVAIVGQTLVSSTQHPTALALKSAATRGLRDARLIEALAVSDKRTAEQIATWVSARFSAPAVSVELRDKQSTWASVPLGAVVMYSDAELGWSGRLGVLVKREWRDTWSGLTVELYAVKGVS